MSRLHFTALMCITLLGSGCDFDPMHNDERTIAGSYRLKRWEDGTAYYLRTPADTTSTMRDRPIARLGWDHAHVVLLRGPADQDRGAWEVVNVITNDVRYLLPTELGRDSVAGRIPTYQSDSAWARLGAVKRGT